MFGSRKPTQQILLIFLIMILLSVYIPLQIPTTKAVTGHAYAMGYWGTDIYQSVDLTVSSTTVKEGDLLTVTVVAEGNASGLSHGYGPGIENMHISLKWGNSEVVSFSPVFYRNSSSSNEGSFTSNTVIWTDRNWGSALYPSPSTFTVTFRLGAPAGKVGNQDPVYSVVASFGIMTVPSSVATVYLNAQTSKDDLEIKETHLIQVEKDPQVIVQGKKAAIEVDLFSTYSSSVRAMIKVTYDFGNKVFTESGPEGVGVRIYPGENRIYLPGGPNLPGDTEAWESPGEGSYLYWSKSGTDDGIKVSIDPNNYLNEQDRTNNVKLISEKIVDTAGLKILVVPVYFPDIPPEGPVGFQTIQQTANLFNVGAIRADLSQQLRFLTETYPISEDKILLNLAPTRALHTKPGTTMNNLYDMSWLRRYVALPLTKEAKIAGYDRVVILIDGITFRDWMGVAIGMLKEPENRAPVIILPEYLHAGDYLGAYLLAHELGHTYYLWHPEGLPGGASTADNCDSYIVYSRQYEKNAFTFMAIFKDKAGPYWIDDARYESYPETTVTLKYENKVVQTKDSNLLYQFRSSPDPEVVLVSGIIFNNSTAETNDPWIRLEGIPDIQSGSVGDYSITLSDNFGTVLGKFGFNASLIGFDEVDDKFVGSTSDAAPFVFSVPYISGVVKIDLTDSSGKVLLSKSVTKNAPTVTLGTPKGGEIFSSNSSITIKWNATDIDGDSLLYSVFYSSDRGQSWVPLSSNQPENTYMWNTTDINIGSDYKIKVLVTDGVNTGESQTNTTFAIDNPHEIRFTFSKVASPNDYNSTNPDTRPLAVAFDYLEYLDVNKTVIGKIDIGTDEATQILTSGWSYNQGVWGTAANYVWAGGINKTATINLPQPSSAAFLRIKIRPFMSDNPVMVFYGANLTATINPSVGWNEYDFALSTPLSQNLLTNPDFENGLTGWNISQGNAVYSFDSTIAHLGNNAAKGVETNTGSLGRLYQDVTNVTSPGSQYQISGWIKTSNVTGFGATIALSYVDSNGWTPSDGYVNLIGFINATQDWTFFQSTIFTLPAKPSDTKTLWFLFDFYASTGTAWWDNVSLTKVTTTPSPTPTPTSTPTSTPSPTPTSTSSPSPSPSPTPPNTITATTENGAKLNLTLSGNITSLQMSNVVFSSNQTTSTTILSFTLSGNTGSSGYGNITIPKSAVTYGTTPTIYIDDILAADQAFTQDANNYYVWYATHFSTHQILILFAAGYVIPESPIIMLFSLTAISALLAGITIRKKETNRKLDP